MPGAATPRRDERFEIWSSPHPNHQCFLLRAAAGAALQLAVEAMFLEVVLRVTLPGSSGLSERQTDALQDLAFNWILAADRYVEQRLHELGSAREKASIMFPSRL